MRFRIVLFYFSPCTIFIMNKIIYPFIFIILAINLSGQKFLQLESYGQAKTQKIAIGTPISYKLSDHSEWEVGIIRDFLIEENKIELEDRFLSLSDIKALRFNRRFAKVVQSGLYVFGASWSTFALLGYTFDRDPATHYSTFDLGVTLSSGLLGWGIGKLFKYKTFKVGNRKKLRLIDITF